MTLAVDHIVVAASDLASGVRWCEATLGVTPSGGGRHALMGTHNRLVRLSSPAFPRSYLEIVAIDPDAPAPGRARWFGLDTIDLRGGPRLVHAVMRSTSIQTHVDGLRALGHDPGRLIEAHRDTPAGRLHWRIAVRDDGALPDGGRLPMLIDWPAAHPADSLPDQGLTLTQCTLPAWTEAERRLLAPPQAPWSHAQALSVTLDTGFGARTMTA